MKKLLISSLLAVGLVATGYSQTNNPGSVDSIGQSILNTLNNSNILTAVYGVYDDKSHDLGYGIGFGYRLNDYVVPFVRVESIHGRGWSPSGTMQLQLPIHLGKFDIVPLAWTGIEVPLGTHGNMEPVGIVGTGVSIHLPKSDKWYVPYSVLAGYERLAGATVDENHILFGLSWAL